MTNLCPLPAKPPQGTVKLNIDASFEYEGSTASIGAILRDDVGDFIAAEVFYMGKTIDTYTSEAMAMKKGLQLADSLGIHKLLVHTDCAELVKEINQGAVNSVAAPILNDCFEICNNFGHVSFEHCARESNRVAHELARRARVDPPGVWADNPPSFIRSLILDDLSLFEMK